MKFIGSVNSSFTSKHGLGLQVEIWQMGHVVVLAIVVDLNASRYLDK